MRIIRIVAVVTLLVGAWPAAAAQPTPEQQNEFVPMTEVPPEEQMPAPTMVASAYGFAWIAILGYFWVVSRRLGRVEKELQHLERESH
ncbi:MAG: CcmD family protein [Vicinamibacterales bacterium]